MNNRPGRSARPTRSERVRPDRFSKTC